VDDPAAEDDLQSVVRLRAGQPAQKA
jgi:hypothetical protein